MAVTINNVTINNQLTIINDAGVNASNTNNGPKSYSGDTEADVNIDGTTYLNLTASDIIPSNVHALQFKPATDSGEIEFDGTGQNQAITESDIPDWAKTMVKRWNGEKAYWDTYNTSYTNAVNALDSESASYGDDVAAAQTAAVSQATTAKNNILSA
jgi:hypothetical protein|tara:strand:- start:8857 stop:9327 length:471 start_codon:yes stop_codon:yes gene_type:complete